MLDYGVIILFIVEIITNLVNIPLKFLKFIQTTTDTFRIGLIKVFEEIRRTGEFTFTVTIVRKVHQESPVEVLNEESSP